MVEALAFALAAYAPFGGWPWWSVLLLGAAAGFWTVRIRPAFWNSASERLPMDTGGAKLIVGAMVLGAGLCLMVYFAARSIALQS